MFKILFVCTGNTCRSSLAAVIAAQAAARQGFSPEDIQIYSAGLAAVEGMPATPEAIQAAREMGLDLSNHRAAGLTGEMVKEAGLILTMTRGHKEALLKLYPEAQGKVFTLKEYVNPGSADPDIADPIGRPLEVYRRTARELEELTSKLLEKVRKVMHLRLALGSDHGGFKLKEEIKKFLEEQGIPYRDFGTFNAEAVDYPDFARPVAEAVARGECDRGILCCGTGIGVAIAANKVPGIRAALCHDTFSARAAREHNDANILTMGERVIGPGLAREIVATWLASEFAGGRHARRVEKIKAIEEAYNRARP
ncbi:MAG: ribose 5-phosphate isomerase [Clostridia bacterium]|nr:ribose 5-phosphate isomerase [Clostridia bacterium]